MGGVVKSVLDPLTGESATKSALKSQKNATNSANATLSEQFNNQLADLAPWRQAGMSALSQLQDPNFGKNMEMDPGYQFGLQEGQKGMNAGLASRGMANSGAALKALSRFNSDYATTKYNDAYNRQYSRLTGLMGAGQDANNAQINARGAYGQGIAGNVLGLGNAQASAKIASADRMSGLIGQGLTAFSGTDKFKSMFGK